MLVPLPTSSSTIRLRFVALFRMFAVSFISTMNVEFPRVSSSLAPTRVKIRSTTPILASFAGTKLPICAIRAVSATCRMNVLFPAMFGPVIRRTRLASPSRSTSFGTKRSSWTFSTTGCLPSTTRISVPSSTTGFAYLPS